MSCKEFRLDDAAVGFAELSDNCWNFSIYSDYPDDCLVAEYKAGFIQGKLQKTLIPAARDNAWNNMYYCDPSHKFPRWLRPNREEMEEARKILLVNYVCVCRYARSTAPYAGYYLRLLMRLIGIYHGIVYEHPCLPGHCEELIPDVCIFSEKELKLNYGTDKVSFLDLYFINVQSDLEDIVSSRSESCGGTLKPDHCSAFLKRTEDDIFMTHNTWSGFLSQSMTMTYTINGTFITQNVFCPGQFGSNTDFGFNGSGLCFNETTHRSSYTETKVEGMWLCWRSAVAEMFATSIDEFYEMISSDNTGTYLSGYMVMDVKSGETALVEMSYRRFVYFKSSGGAYTITDSLKGEVSVGGYDTGLLTPEYIFGVNYPISYDVGDDLLATDNRPMRRKQFAERIAGVCDIETAKQLITHTDNSEPLSIYGRWDLGYGTTDFPRTTPDGAIDAKACSASMIRKFLAELQNKPDKTSGKTSFWMKYGTPKIDGKPFIWSESKWRGQILNHVPNVVDGEWHLTKIFMN